MYYFLSVVSSKGPHFTAKPIRSEYSVGRTKESIVFLILYSLARFFKESSSGCYPEPTVTTLRDSIG